MLTREILDEIPSLDLGAALRRIRQHLRQQENRHVAVGYTLRAAEGKRINGTYATYGSYWSHTSHRRTLAGAVRFIAPPTFLESTREASPRSRRARGRGGRRRQPGGR